MSKEKPRAVREANYIGVGVSAGPHDHLLDELLMTDLVEVDPGAWREVAFLRIDRNLEFELAASIAGNTGLRESDSPESALFAISTQEGAQSLVVVHFDIQCASDYFIRVSVVVKKHIPVVFSGCFPCAYVRFTHTVLLSVD